jgi:hypothetical protein
VPAILGALDRSGVRVAADPGPARGGGGACGVHVLIDRFVPVSFLVYRSGMTEREETLFALAVALRSVPPGVWRDLGGRRLPADELPEKAATRRVSVAALVGRVAAARPAGASLASALRTFALEQARRGQQEQRQPGDWTR